MEVNERHGDKLMKSISDTKTDHKERCFIAFHLEYPQNMHINLNISRFLSKKKQTIQFIFQDMAGKRYHKKTY